MSYIGNQSENKVSPAFMRETLSPNGSATYFDLIHDVPGYQAENLLVTVNNVIQEPVNAYTIINDGNNRPRRLNFGVALASTDSLYVIHRGSGELYHTPPANSVGATALQDNLKSGNVDSFTATAGQTAFTLSEIPLNANSIHVYVNGIFQKPLTNYTVTGSSTALTLSSGILVGDEVDVFHNTIRSTVSHVADASVTTTKMADDAVTTAKIEDNLTLPGSSVRIPNITTTQRDALTEVVGMLIYNTTIGLLQQYNAAGWTSIDAPPTLSSFTYPDSGTALDPAGSTTATLVLTGSNFSVGVTVLIDGTAPTSTTRNSATQITITGFPAKAAATYSAGLKVTNASGLAASADIIYDAVPAWTTAAGSLGSFIDGAYTNSSSTTIRIVAAEGSDTIDYAQVSDATGNTVITSGVAGLTLGTTGANAGYLTGTLSGDQSSTYNFYAKAQDDENQFSSVRLFNIISAYPGTGGTVTTYSGYRVHTFLTSGTFVAAGAITIDYLVVAGGGGGGAGHAGGGGAGGMRTAASYSLAAGSHTITVGAGGASNAHGAHSSAGANSSIAALIVATGGGGGGGRSYDGSSNPARTLSTGNAAGGWGGSGGGAGYGHENGTNVGGSGINDGGTFGTVTFQGYGGGPHGAAVSGGSGGGGAGGLGVDGSGNNGGAGGTGRANYYRDGNGSGTTIGTHLFAGGGGGGPHTPGSGGSASHGGGAGSSSAAAGTDGTANSGGGGGSGAYYSSTNYVGGDGGSGIVVIRYAV